MYKFVFYLFLSISLFACNNSTNTSSKKTKSEDPNKNSAKEYQTKSGKIFRVHTDYSLGASICKVKVETKHFEKVNTTHDLGNLDPVKEIFLADLDGNGYEEIYLLTQSAGSGSYGNIYGIGSNRDRSATPIYVRPITTKQKEPNGLFEGYSGHDKFMLKGDKLYREFPVYEKTNTNSRPTGGTKKIQYKLVAGEAGWILEPH